MNVIKRILTSLLLHLLVFLIGEITEMDSYANIDQYYPRKLYYKFDAFIRSVTVTQKLALSDRTMVAHLRGGGTLLNSHSILTKTPASQKMKA